MKKSYIICGFRMSEVQLYRSQEKKKKSGRHGFLDFWIFFFFWFKITKSHICFTSRRDRARKRQSPYLLSETASLVNVFSSRNKCALQMIEITLKIRIHVINPFKSQCIVQSMTESQSGLNK